MKQIELMEVLQNADMSFLFPLFKKLLGYDPFVKFYAPNPEARLLCQRIGEQLEIELDPSFVEFMSITNGGFVDVVQFMNFKNLENKMMDLLYLNLDKNVHATLTKYDTAFIVGKFANDYYCYDKRSNMEKTKSKAYAWGLYDTEKQEYAYTFETFYDLLEYHINVLGLSF